MGLREAIDATPWIDTHEHLVEERFRLGPETYSFTEPPEGLRTVLPADWSSLLVNYALNDLVVAGLPPIGAEQLLGSELSALEKWDLAEPYLKASRHTGYLRAVDISTERLFGHSLARETCEEIDGELRALRVEGYYERVLREVANVSHCHVNTLEADPFCETHSPDLLRQDLAIGALATGRHEAMEQASGTEVSTLDDYLQVVEWCFDRYGDQAVALKCAWAYQRPLAVLPPASPPRTEFDRLRCGIADPADQRLVEDFLFQRCLDLATQAHLPVKIHLGYLDGTGHRQFGHTLDHVRDIIPIVQGNPDTTFVLMHAAWPQQEQLLALAKHQPNVVLDLCWAWIVGPVATRDFLTRALTTVPATKLLCFGGDYSIVENVVGHAEIARRGLQAALEQLIDDRWLTTDDALALVPLLMNGNAERIFPPGLSPRTSREGDPAPPARA
jgi:hypothetical protein